MEISLVTDLVILAGALTFVGWPLANPARAEADATARQKRRVALEDEKERLLAALADLEHDRATGKMEDSDFATISLRIKTDAARVLREIDLNDGKKLLRPGETPAPAAIQPGDDTIPGMTPRPLAATESDEVARLKKQLEAVEADRKRLEAAQKLKTFEESSVAAKGAFCTKCGRQAKSTSDRFCGKCGTALPDDVIN